MKAFLGMGLLGANFVRAMLARGESVNVWNRTPGRAKALEAEGASVFEDLIDAIRGVDQIHLTLRDDDAVNEVLQKARPGFSAGVTIIDHTTTSPKGAIERTLYWKGEGYTYLHAPVFMGPQNAKDSTGFMLVSGDQGVISRWTPTLSAMTGKLLNFGPEEGKAASMKLIGNLFLQCVTTGLSDALALGKATGVSPDEILRLFEDWNPGASVGARLHKMTQGTFQHPSWELTMARKDTGLMMDAAARGGAPLAVVPAIAAEMDKWIAEGHAHDDWSVIAKNNLP